MQLGWAEFLPDDRDALTAAYRRSFASGDVVLSCGGIGGTPDDHTRQAAAAALDLPLALHPEAEEAIALRTAEMAAGAGHGRHEHAREPAAPADGRVPARLRDRAESLQPHSRLLHPRHTFVPGFPVMAWPMLEWTLDTRYRAMQHQRSHVEHSFLVFRMPESRITPAMQTVESRWPGVRRSACPAWARLAARRISTWA